MMKLEKGNSDVRERGPKLPKNLDLDQKVLIGQIWSRTTN